ncbi:MAG: Gfo/Idh/MocA family oxidoreductase [Thermoguttaceae bacterium]|nr:Gfo/Idh/MocA family oxidoreductase [Thermoguttaceae bacterium]
MTSKNEGNVPACECSRRNFLKAGALSAVVPAVGVGAFCAGYSSTHPRRARIAVMGVGDEGSVLLGACNPEFVEIVAIADIRPYNQYRAFHGDHYGDVALAARPGLMKLYGWETEDEARKHVKVYSDYRDLLKDADKLGIEAVIVGLPLHLHAPACIQAMSKGLHVLCEKLMGHSIIECKEMARAAKFFKKHLAIGHQRHYNILYQEATDQIERGILGDVHYIRAQWHRGNSPGADSWQMPMPEEFKADDPQASKLAQELAEWTEELNNARGLEIETWRRKVEQKKAQLADALMLTAGESYNGVTLKSPAEYGYEDMIVNEGGKNEYRRPSTEELIRWRLWKRTGGGLMVELGSHQLDAASIFLAASNRRACALRGEDPSQLPDNGKVHPLRVHVSANRNLFALDREVQDHITTLVEFPAPNYDPETPAGRRRTITVQYSTINGNGFGGYGEIVYGTKGTIILEREQDSQLLRGPSTSKVEKKAAGASALDTQASAPAQKAVAAGPAGPAVSRGYKEEVEHWIWCAQNNPKCADPDIQPRCNPRIALGDAVIALVANIAADKGESVQFDEKWFDPFDDKTPEDDLGVEKGVPNIDQDKYKL